MPASFHRLALSVAFAFIGFTSALSGQAPPTPPALPTPAVAPSAAASDDGFTTLDSTVGYIESAIPWSQVRFRYDAADNLNRPNRAEFFYAKPKPNGPGLPFPERNINYQELNIYGEMLLVDRLSIFAEMPFRFLDPTVNQRQQGPSDITVGGKYACIMQDDFVTSVTFKVTAPSGQVNQGLGTGHVTLEQGLLAWYKINDRWGIEGEFRQYTPIGGTDFSGDVIRYGLGVYHNLYIGDKLRVAPVAEVVGWTVLGGKEQFLLPSGVGVIHNAAGDTIVNAKIGLRMGFGTNSDMYIGYGRSLTGDRWYQDVFRLEFRRRF